MLFSFILTIYANRKTWNSPGPNENQRIGLKAGSVHDPGATMGGPGVATAGILDITHASFLREPGGGGSTSSCKTKYLPNER